MTDQETTAPAEELPTVQEALSRVMEEVQSIRKDDRNTTQNFNYRGIDAVVNAVGPALRNHRVVAVPFSAELVGDERYTTKNNANMRGVTVLVRWRFYGPAGDYIEAGTLGEAADAGDKAVPKASSVAYRTLLLQALCIPTDEPDPDSQSHERAPRAEEKPAVPLPKSWGELEGMVSKVDNGPEAWALFQAFLRAAGYHLYGDTDQAKLTQEQRDVLWQKARGAYAWLMENVQYDGPFFYFDEAAIRRAWAHVLNGAQLEIPDYVPPKPEPTTDEIDDAQRQLDEAAAEAALAPDVGD